MKKITLFLFFIGFTTLSFSQLHSCGQHTILNELLKDSVFKAQYELDQKIQKEVLDNFLLHPSQKRGVIYKIPVVFHVLHSNGIENISKEQIYSQLAILNRDFRLQNADAANVHPDFKGMPTDVQIEFVLATKAPDGTCFSGITRTYTPNPIVSGSSQVSYIRDNNDVYNGEWTGNKYLHFFISSDLGGPAGYTYKPYGSGSTMSSGIFIKHDFVGSIGTAIDIKSRALTHEVGHWLNLDHTWGGTNAPGKASNCDTDDGVDDTPNCIGDTVCNLNSNACGPRANIENYMEYSYCSKMFTSGQVDKMRAAMVSSVGGRNKIWTTQNLTAVGGNAMSICKADFNSNNLQTCEGGQIVFTDASYNSPVSWSWSFPGGVPSTSTEQNPTVVYPNKGTYSVTLSASDGVSTKAVTKQNLINVLSDRRSIPFLETFSSYTSISNSSFWAVLNPGNNQAFEVISGTGYSDTKCLKLANFVENTTSTDEIISSALDLSNIKDQGQITLTFRYAYRKKNTTNSEVLRVYMSGDCGSTWNSRKTLSGVNLSGIIVTSDWTPTSPTDWTTVHVTNINSTYWNSNTRLRFSFDGSGGNNLFLDDINLYPAAPTTELFVGLTEQQLPEDIRVYPIPTDNELHVEFALQSNLSASYTILDVSGKKVIGSAIQGALGNNLVIIPTNSLLAGSYFLQLNVGGETVMKYFQVTK
jgi:PKD repeat protein